MTDPADALHDLAERVVDDDPFVALAATAATRRQLERIEATIVRRARAQGRTWAEIAESLGVTKQAVHKKYGGRRWLRAEE